MLSRVYVEVIEARCGLVLFVFGLQPLPDIKAFCFIAGAASIRAELRQPGSGGLSSDCTHSSAGMPLLCWPIRFGFYCSHRRASCAAPGIAVIAKLGALRVRNVQLSTSFFVLLECSLLFYCSALSHGAGAHFFISVIHSVQCNSHLSKAV